MTAGDRSGNGVGARDAGRAREHRGQAERAAASDEPGAHHSDEQN
jgi:hypothetical protein